MSQADPEPTRQGAAAYVRTAMRQQQKASHQMDVLRRTLRGIPFETWRRESRGFALGTRSNELDLS